MDSTSNQVQQDFEDLTTYQLDQDFIQDYYLINLNIATFEDILILLDFKVYFMPQFPEIPAIPSIQWTSSWRGFTPLYLLI